MAEEMARGGYWTLWFPDRDSPGEIDRLPSARHAIASAETSVEQRGGSAYVFSRTEGRPFILLRKVGLVWPEAMAAREGEPIEFGPLYLNGWPITLRLVDLPSRRERRTAREQRPIDS
jgi:hypothetical protein